MHFLPDFSAGTFPFVQLIHLPLPDLSPWLCLWILFSSKCNHAGSRPHSSECCAAVHVLPDQEVQPRPRSLGPDINSMDRTKGLRNTSPWLASRWLQLNPPMALVVCSFTASCSHTQWLQRSLCDHLSVLQIARQFLGFRLGLSCGCFQVPAGLFESSPELESTAARSHGWQDSRCSLPAPRWLASEPGLLCVWGFSEHR